MGGNALKQTATRRYKAGEYHALSDRVVSMLSTLFPNRKVAVIKSYNNKESFGDLDVLLEKVDDNTDYQKAIRDTFDTREIVKNGNIYSFGFRQLQVDLILTPKEELETSYNYFAYNDLGNLVGRIARSLGLKYGHDGLSYDFKSSDTVMHKNVVLLTDLGQIYDVLGLDVNRHNEGFNDLTDIFDFVISSRFFRKDMFLFENRNHKSRVRDAKRKTYCEFLKYIIDYEDVNPKKSKQEYLPYLLERIEGFQEIYDNTWAEIEEGFVFAERFNGDVVKTITGLQGKELGLFITFCKQRHEHSEGGLRKFILRLNSELVDRYINYLYLVYVDNLPRLEDEVFKEATKHLNYNKE